MLKRLFFKHTTSFPFLSFYGQRMMISSLVPSSRSLLARGTAFSSPLMKQLGSRTGGFARCFSCSHSFVTNPMQKRDNYYYPSLRTFSSTSKKPSLPFLLDREIENEGSDEITDSPSLMTLLSKLEKKGFKIEENPDSPVVALVGKGLGSEEIVITLNVMDDITEDEEELEYDEDDEGDTNLNAQSVPDIRGEDEPPLDDGIESEPVFEISVVIRKDEEEIEFICEASSHISISSVNFYPDDARFEDEAHLYTGPNFDELDPELQEAFEDYLEKRGIDDDVATFLCMYADAKEQNLYVKWMTSVRNFLNK